MRPALLLIVALALQDPEQPIRDFTATVWEGDTLAAQIKADKAVISERDKTTVSGELHGADITYYTQPRTPEEQSQKVNLKAGVGTIDGKKLNFDLRDSVAVAMEDGSRIETSDLFVSYRLQHVTTKSAIRMTRPNIVLTGTGFEADDTLRQVTVLKDGVIEVIGNPRAPLPATPSTMVTRLSCAGPLSVRDLSLEIPGDRRTMRIDARDGVRLEREDGGRRVTATCDNALIYATVKKEPTGGESIEPVSLTMRGRITIVDSGGMEADAASADWSLDDDLLRLAGAPRVDVVQGGQRVTSRVAVLDRWAGRATFRDDLLATLRTSPESKPLEVRATELVLETERAGGRLQGSWVRAVGNVRVSGEAGPKGGRIDATGTRFSWNASEGRGALHGSPFARIVQGESTIDAPEVLFEGRSMFVVKGPKRMRLIEEKPRGAFEKVWNPPGRTEISIMTDGDVVYDGTAGQVRMIDRCEVQSDDVKLAADRLTLVLSENGQGVSDVRGQGRVVVERPGMRFLGDTLSYAPATGKVEVRGEPHVVALFRAIETRNAIVRYDPSTGRVEAEGGRYRGKIEIPR